MFNWKITEMELLSSLHVIVVLTPLLPLETHSPPAVP